MGKNTKNNRQHVVPESYLKRFTEDGSKHGRLYVYDVIRDKFFPTTPNKVANIKQYYRLGEELYPGIAPDFIDQFLDRNVPHLNEVIEWIIQKKEIPREKDVFRNLHMQMALLMARSPESRFNSKLLQEVAMKEHVLSQIESAPELLRKEVAKKGIYASLNIEFNEDYFIAQIPREAASCYDSLVKRCWQIVESPRSHFFLTSDLPISIKRIDNRPTRYGANLLELNSRIFFPVSKNVGLIGEFRSFGTGYRRIGKRETACLNTQILERPYSQIFSSSENFMWLNAKSNIANKEDFLRFRRSPKLSAKYARYHEEKRVSRLENVRRIFLDRYDPETMQDKRRDDNATSIRDQS